LGAGARAPRLSHASPKLEKACHIQLQPLGRHHRENCSLHRRVTVPAARTMHAIQVGQTAQHPLVARRPITAAPERSLIRSVIWRWVIASEEPRKRREAVFQLVAHVVVRVLVVHMTTFRPTPKTPQTNPCSLWHRSLERNVVRATVAAPWVRARLSFSGHAHSHVVTLVELVASCRVAVRSGSLFGNCMFGNACGD
jgi:hypothetical protein